MKILVNNKKALFNYTIIDKYECGISLLGAEVKSIVKSQANLDEAFVVFRNNEAFVLNMQVTPWAQSNLKGDDALRTRKLLLHKNEILKIQNYIKKNKATVVVLNIHLEHGKIKLTIATAKRKNASDKRETKKKKDAQREIKKFI
ncbi:MAG: SsrA-binding protein SmpB [Mycoplasma sp.]|nr:SsrA-binding protein SmpB [Candidatus Hennigella equi]